MEPPRHAHLHDAVDLLGLAGEAEALQEHAQRRQQIDAVEVERPHVLVQHRSVELFVLSQELADLLLVQQARRPQKPRHFARRRLLRQQPCASPRRPSPTAVAEEGEHRLVAAVELRHGLQELVAAQHQPRAAAAAVRHVAERTVHDQQKDLAEQVGVV